MYAQSNSVIALTLLHTLARKLPHSRQNPAAKGDPIAHLQKIPHA